MTFSSHVDDRIPTGNSEDDRDISSERDEEENESDDIDRFFEGKIGVVVEYEMISVTSSFKATQSRHFVMSSKQHPEQLTG